MELLAALHTIGHRPVTRRTSWLHHVGVVRVLRRMGILDEIKILPTKRHGEGVAQELKTRFLSQIARHSYRVCRVSSPQCHRCPLVSFCQVGLATNRRNKDNRPLAIDVFAGAGSLSAGFVKEGFRVALAIEKSRHAAQTYRHNHPGVPVLEIDAGTASPFQIAKMAGLRPGSLSVVMGGPPCQGYSVAGLRKSGSRQNHLYRVIARMARVLKARMLIMENVPGLKRVGRVNFMDRIIQFVEDQGFSVRAVELDASRFGVPQRRRRLIFFGTNRRLKLNLKFSVPVPFMRGRNVIQALKGLPPLASGERCEVMDNNGAVIYNHRAMAHSRNVVAKIRKIGFNNAPISYRRLPRTLAHTIIAGHRALPVHPRQHRTITVREAARLQTLPDKFRFLGPHSEQPLQVANAVPYNLARAIARAALRTLVQS